MLYSKCIYIKGSPDGLNSLGNDPRLSSITLLHPALPG